MGACLSAQQAAPPSSTLSSDVDWDALASSAGGSARCGDRSTGAAAADAAGNAASAPASPFAALAGDEWADVAAYTRNLDLPMVKCVCVCVKRRSGAWRRAGRGRAHAGRRAGLRG
jgi:hypothetical protein